MAGNLHCKKRLTIFPCPAGMSPTKLSLAGNNLIVHGEGEFGKWHPGWGRDYCSSCFTVYSLSVWYSEEHVWAQMLPLLYPNLSLCIFPWEYWNSKKRGTSMLPQPPKPYLRVSTAPREKFTLNKGTNIERYRIIKYLLDESWMSSVLYMLLYLTGFCTCWSFCQESFPILAIILAKGTRG